jgi:hypothetical protein
MSVISELMAGTCKPHHYVRLFQEIHDDLQMWLNFLGEFNGISKFPVLDGNRTKLTISFRQIWSTMMWSCFVLPGFVSDGHSIMRDMTFWSLSQ